MKTCIYMLMKSIKHLSNYLLRVLLTLFIVFLTGCSFDDQVESKQTKNPNIVFIFVDDMGYGDVGVYNKDSKIPTPNIDSLAREGIRFMDAHSPAALCHPSRYGLLTGRYPFRTDVTVWEDKPLIEEGRMTIASVLQTSGYHTSMVGKWHLGFDESQTKDRSVDRQGIYGTRTAFREYDPNQILPGGPVDHGFDSFFGIRASTDIPPYFYIRGDRVVTPPTDKIEENLSGGHLEYNQGAFWRAGGIAPDLELIDVTPRFTDEAIKVIEGHHNERSSSPLMLYLAYPSPHTPWLPVEEFQGVSGAGMYGDFMAMIDAHVGKILEALERTGMSEETLVVFTSDNGPVWHDKDRERYGHDASGGLRGMKGDAFEGGHRVPFIVRWPGVVEPGRVTGQTISFTDLLATFAEIVDKDLPENAGEDSFSILPVLTGSQLETEAIRPPVVMSTLGRGVRAIQDGTWKLIEGLGSGGRTVPVHIVPGPGDPEGQLYNLKQDLGETNNLWHDHPEEVNRLLQLLNKYDQKERSRP